jgi:phosphatidylglycerophosphate synthase
MLPEAVTPNTLTLLGSVSAWGAFAAASTAPWFEGSKALMLRSAAGLGIFLVMVFDCLDGMQARRTGRSSKLGELLDHQLDAINTPLCAASLCITLELEPWLVAIATLSGTWVYHAQLVLWHHRGRFIPAPTSGTVAQLGIALLFPVLGLLLFASDREAEWVDMLVNGVAVASVAATLWQARFYYVRLEGLFVHHLGYLVISGVFAALFVQGMMTPIAFAFCAAFVSLRANGGYVLFTLIGRPYRGWDWLIALMVLATAGLNLFLAPVQVRGYNVQDYLPYGFGLMFLALSVFGVLRHLDELKHLDHMVPVPVRR